MISKLLTLYLKRITLFEKHVLSIRLLSSWVHRAYPLLCQNQSVDLGKVLQKARLIVSLFKFVGAVAGPIVEDVIFAVGMLATSLAGGIRFSFATVMIGRQCRGNYDHRY